jgi:hypothetical protein
LASSTVAAARARRRRDVDDRARKEAAGPGSSGWATAFQQTRRRIGLRVSVVTLGWTAALVVAGVGAGVWIGVKLTKDAVQSGVDDSADKVIRAIGGDPTTGYGHVAHTIVDAFAGNALENG